MTLQARIDQVLSQAFSYEEALKMHDRSEADIDELRKLVANDKTIPNCCTDRHLVIFMANDVGAQEAYEKVKLYFKLKRFSPEVFRYREPSSDEISTTCQNHNFFFLPPTPEGYQIVYGSMKNQSVSTFIFDSVAKAFFMTAEACLLKQGPQRGIIFLIDMAGGKLFHLSKVNLKTVRMGLKFALDGSPLRIVAFHILNAVPFYNLIMTIMRPFARKELKQLLNLHYADIDWEDFYAKHIPKACLPSDYGGDLESVEELSKKNYSELGKLSDYYELEEQAVYSNNEDVNDTSI